MKKRLLLSILLFGYFATAQKNIENTDSLAGRFISDVRAGTTEKLFVQTNKNIFVAGEELWFKAWILNSLSHKYFSQSKTLYADLVNEKDSVLQIKHLLQMTSGMNFDEDYGNPLGFMAKAYYGKDLYKLVKGYELKHTPGTVHEYLGGNNLLLSITLQKVLGKSVSEYAEEKLWKKIGTEYPARWILDHENGYEKSFTGFFATARDFAKIGKLWMQWGKFNGEQIVDSGFVAQAISPVGVPDTKNIICDYYGYAWWLTEFKGDKVFYMRGILGQYVFCVPSKNLIVVRLGKDRSGMSNGITPDDVAIYLQQAYSFL
mgnify:CR=1 FL=1